VEQKSRRDSFENLRENLVKEEAKMDSSKADAGKCNSDELKNRVAVVTGAGSGLGRSIAVGLARAGSIIGLVDIDAEAVKQTSVVIKKELSQAQALALTCDVTKEADVDVVFEKVVKDFGVIDILVNAAGVAPAAALVDMPVDKWRFALEVNLTGYFLMARAATRLMIKQGSGGVIINISSKSGL
jgi:NAD(P)-dependent dehydrogenase (short-subunit alcohol dehydrogenase family)